MMRQAIARSMAHSKREIPHYYLANHIDLDRALGWLTAHNEDRPISERILPAVLLLKATALALRETPDLNGYWVDGGFRPSESIHLGVAISLREGGLVAPAIHDVDRLSLEELMLSLRDLVNRARSWRLRSSEMSDPTITVTNLGDRGVETAFPVIIPPQVAIVGFGRVVDQLVAVDGQPVVHPVVHATLAGDHRVTDGHRGALFLDALDRLLQEPENL
jgi:pyruvate dehydrogenase E2 component (dihydrolipoamide acetyltransferase)